MNTKIRDCYIKYNDNTLCVGNSKMERIWNLKSNIPVSISVKDKEEGKEWLDSDNNVGIFGNPHIDFSNLQDISVAEPVSCDNMGFSQESLNTKITLTYKDIIVEWTIIQYPHMPIMRNSFVFYSKDKGIPLVDKSTENYLPYESDPDIFRKSRDVDYMEHIAIKATHCKWKCVELCDQTDDNDSLVQERYGIVTYRDIHRLQGNILALNDTLADACLMLIKEGPTPCGYIGNAQQDYILAGHSIFITGLGWTPDLVSPEGISAYTTALILSRSGEEQETEALMTYHDCIHSYTDDRDALVMCNTWGDMSCDGKIGEEFLLKELEVAKDLGVNYYQIDDGWQKGKSGASVFPGGIQDKSFYENDPDFWTVDKNKFPSGLDPIVQKAKEYNIKLGLWFSPDESDNYALWRKDADVIITLHRQYGISAFKIDGVRYPNKIAEENLFKMMDTVVKETNGKIFFNMDVTADRRSGYYGRVHYGNIFLENRFTDGFPVNPNYFPYRTLRSIWNLAHYYPVYRIQAEVLNTNRNQNLYGDDPLAPAKCGQEYVFALSSFASPLLWMELTGLTNDGKKALSQLISRYTPHQAKLHKGVVYPIGSEPDGTSWSGLQSVTGKNTGYLLIIREYAHNSTSSIKIKDIHNAEIKIQPVFGEEMPASITVDKNGYAEFTLPNKHSFSLFAYSL